MLQAKEGEKTVGQVRGRKRLTVLFRQCLPTNITKHYLVDYIL